MIASGACIFLLMQFGLTSPAYADMISTGGGGSSPIIASPNEIMFNRKHGTCPTEVQRNLRFGTDATTADKVACFNQGMRAEIPGYVFQENKKVEKDLEEGWNRQLTFFDSVNGKKVFKGPVERDAESFINESKEIGYLSFRDAEVDWQNVRLLTNGNLVSTDGTFLGRAAPDKNGNRYAVNLSAISGKQKDNWIKTLVPDPKDELT